MKDETSWVFWLYVVIVCVAIVALIWLVVQGWVIRTSIIQTFEELTR